MTLSGEKYAWQVIEFPLSSSFDKAEAHAKLAQIEQIKRRNEVSLRQYQVR